jgi:hypothetical protein
MRHHARGTQIRTGVAIGSPWSAAGPAQRGDGGDEGDDAAEAADAVTSGMP